MKTINDNIFIILLAFILCILYLGSLPAPFLFDDRHMITHNVYITHHKYYLLFFHGHITSYPIPQGMYRPLLMLTFAFNYAQGKLNPIGYHLINILIHFLNSTLLYVIIHTLFPQLKKRSCALITLIFAVHPLYTETVIYISCRSDLLVTLFILSAFAAFLNKNYGITFFLYLAALFTKETALCLPLILVSYEYFAHSETKNIFKYVFNQKKKTAFYLLLFIVSVLYLYQRTRWIETLHAIPPRSLIENLLVQCRVFILYLKLFFYPHPLTISHKVITPTSPFDASVLFVLLLVLFTLIFSFKTKHKKLSTWSVIWVIIGMIPLFYARLNIIGMEHHFYFPSIGLYFLLAFTVTTFSPKVKKIFWAVSFPLICLLSLLTITRSFEYNNQETFFMKALRYNPHSGTLHNLLGYEFFNQGNLDKARRHFILSLHYSERKMDIIVAKINIAKIYLATKKYTMALKLLMEVKNDTHTIIPLFYETLGNIYQEMGKNEKAYQAWHKELQNNPAAFTSAFNIGMFHLKKGDVQTARSFFQQLIDRAPFFYGGYYGLGLINKQENNENQANYYFKKAYSLIR